MKRIVIVIVLFLVGFTIFSYPIVSNWVQAKRHETIIHSHHEAVKQLSPEAKTNEKNKAQAYNEQLQSLEMAVMDPFSPEEENLQMPGYYDVLNIGQAMGHIEIPKLNIDLPIYHGVSDDVLQAGIGHMANSSFPVGGQGTHAVLTGHRGLATAKLFRHLDRLEINDFFYIHTLNDSLIYMVDQIDIVLPTETSWLTMEPEEDLVTLITCEPYMINSHRLLVRGKRVPLLGPPIGEEKKEDLSAGKIRSHGKHKWIYILSLLALFALCMTFYYKGKVKRDV